MNTNTMQRVDDILVGLPARNAKLCLSEREGIKYRVIDAWNRQAAGEVMPRARSGPHPAAEDARLIHSSLTLPLQADIRSSIADVLLIHLIELVKHGDLNHEDQELRQLQSITTIGRWPAALELSNFECDVDRWSIATVKLNFKIAVRWTFGAYDIWTGKSLEE